MKQFLKAVLNILLLVLALLLVFFLVNGLVQRFLSKHGYTGLFGIGTAVVVSGSMVPELEVGDIVLYQEQDEDAYEKDDIILYIRDRGKDTERLIIHRVVARNGDTFVTKGDANTLEDEPFSSEMVVGRLVCKLPKAGLLGQYTQTAAGRYVLIGSLAALVLLLILLPGRKQRTETVNGQEYLSY